MKGLQGKVNEHEHLKDKVKALQEAQDRMKKSYDQVTSEYAKIECKLVAREKELGGLKSRLELLEKQAGKQKAPSPAPTPATGTVGSPAVGSPAGSTRQAQKRAKVASGSGSGPSSK